MKITIIETEKKEELSIVDHKSGCNWINDLMGNHDALPEYNDDDGTYHMSQDDYDWWKDLTANYQKADDRSCELLLGLSDNENEKMTNELQGISCDLEDLPGCINDICDDYEKK